VTTTIDITALSMIAWPAPMPSSPAPAARPDRASGLDRSARPSKVADRADDAEVSIDQNGIQPSQKSLTQNFGHSLTHSAVFLQTTVVGCEAIGMPLTSRSAVQAGDILRRPAALVSAYSVRANQDQCDM
jgi:hypothetical protein